MLAKRIIPCLDVKAGRVVKGIQFLNLRDCGEPARLGKHYSDEGADELVFLDITATADGRKTMLDWVNDVAREVFIPFTVGGGISSLEHISQLLSAGADRVSINSAAVKNPDLITAGAERFGSQCMVAAIDAKRKAGGGWRVFIAGGRQRTDLDVLSWSVQLDDRGAGEILLTSMGSGRHPRRIRSGVAEGSIESPLHPGHRLGGRRSAATHVRGILVGR